MSNTQQRDVQGILNETSRTIHKHETGADGFQTSCGQTYHLSHAQLQMIQITEATETFDAEKCGSCFEDGRGY